MWLITDHQGQSREAYDGALDVDVVFSPFFNALPIRRTGLYQRAESVTLPVVYVHLPDLTVKPATIGYISPGPGSGIELDSPVAKTDHRRRRGLHRGLPGPGRADLITAPERPAAASSSRQFSSPIAIVTICGREKPS